VAFPMPGIGSHPSVRPRLHWLAHVHQAVGAGVFIDEQNAHGRLHNLKGVRQIVRSRNAAHVALGLRIVRAPVLQLLFLLLPPPPASKAPRCLPPRPAPPEPRRSRLSPTSVPRRRDDPEDSNSLC